MATRRLTYSATATAVDLEVDTVSDIRLPLTDVCFQITDSTAAPLASANMDQTTYTADTPLVTGGLSFATFSFGFNATTGKSGGVCVAAPAMQGGLAANKLLQVGRSDYFPKSVTDHAYDYDGGVFAFTLLRMPCAPRPRPTSRACSSPPILRRATSSSRSPILSSRRSSPSPPERRWAGCRPATCM